MDAPKVEFAAAADRPLIPVARWAGLVALGAVTYPLGIGPAYWLTIHERIPDSASVFIHGTLYRPLWWACGDSSVFAGAVEWYVALWIG